MSRALAIQAELAQTKTIEDLTEVFESIASMHIAKIHGRVVASKGFFAELWKTYSGLRVDPRDRLQRRHVTKGRNAFVAITGEGKLSGGSDEEIVKALITAYSDPQNTDVLVVGSHGESVLKTAGIAIAASFPMPIGDEDVSAEGLVTALNEYDQISVFYHTYESLLVQRVTRIDLISAVRSLGDDVAGAADEETVSARDYIFEPGITEIADYMESVMVGVAVIQIIMESKLAHYAYRFNTMSAAKKRAGELSTSMRLSYYRAKRNESDERTKETLRAMKFFRGATR